MPLKWVFLLSHSLCFSVNHILQNTQPKILPFQTQAYSFMVYLLKWHNSLLFFKFCFLFQTVSAGVQTEYKEIRLQAGVKYIVQVRCTLDFGEWSEWSSERNIQIPKGEWMIAVLLTVFKFQPAQCCGRCLNSSSENPVLHPGTSKCWRNSLVHLTVLCVELSI